MGCWNGWCSFQVFHCLGHGQNRSRLCAPVSMCHQNMSLYVPVSIRQLNFSIYPSLYASPSPCALLNQYQYHHRSTNIMFSSYSPASSNSFSYSYSSLFPSFFHLPPDLLLTTTQLSWLPPHTSSSSHEHVGASDLSPLLCFILLFLCIIIDQSIPPPPML